MHHFTRKNFRLHTIVYVEGREGEEHFVPKSSEITYDTLMFPEEVGSYRAKVMFRHKLAENLFFPGPMNYLNQNPLGFLHVPFYEYLTGVSESGELQASRILEFSTTLDEVVPPPTKHPDFDTYEGLFTFILCSTVDPFPHTGLRFKYEVNFHTSNAIGFSFVEVNKENQELVPHQRIDELVTF
jgi:hypothetical protein